VVAQMLYKQLFPEQSAFKKFNKNTLKTFGKYSMALSTQFICGRYAAFISKAPMMVTSRASETLVNYYQTTTQKTAIIILTTMRTSNPTTVGLSSWLK
jgi:hypothetical protein